MDNKEEKIISGELIAPSSTMALVKWTPSFAIGVSRAVYSGVTQAGTGVRKAFSKEEATVKTSGSHDQVPAETDIMNEFLYEFVENWEGEDPTSPLLFDPDGDFIFLPRSTEEVPEDGTSTSGTSAQPPYVYIHSGLLNALQSVSTWPHNIQHYLKEHLNFLSKTSKKLLDEGDVCSSSDVTSNAATGLDSDTSSVDKSNDQGVSGDQVITENQTVRKDQEEEVSKSGGLPLIDVLANSDEGQVPQPQRSLRHLILTSVKSPLAFRRRLQPPGEDVESSRETLLTEPDENGGQACNQTKDFYTSTNTVEKDVVSNIPEETPVLQIPIQPSEGLVLIPKQVETHLNWIPNRSHFSFRGHSKSSSDHETCVTDEHEIQSEEPTSPLCQASANITDQTLPEDIPSQSYWKPFPVRWLNPDTYRLLVINTIIRRRVDLDVLLDDSHFQGSELSEPAIVDIDFDELKKTFCAFKALKTIKTSKAGTWSFLPVIPTIYRDWRIPLEINSEGQGQPFRRRSSSLGCFPQESQEPFSPLGDSNDSKNINFSNIHDVFKQFAISEDSLGVVPGIEMASPKGGERTTSGGFLRSFRNKMWTRENDHLDERRDGNTSAVPSGNEERIDISPSQKSQQRASQLHQPNQDKNQLTKEWTNARQDLEDFVVAETQSLSGSLDFKKPDEQSRQKDSFSSYLTGPFLSKTCYICKESLSTFALLMRKSQDYQCKKCKHLFCKKCLISNLQGGECMACRQDITKQKEDISTFGASRSLTKPFKDFRDKFNTYGWDIERHQEQFRFHPTIASVLRQCRRLTHGYKKCLEDNIDPNKMPGGGLLKRGIPPWQKPPTWIEAGTKEVRGCQLCSKEWFVDPLHNCRLCGRRVCSQDSSRDLMLYIPDQNTTEYLPKMKACWKIIRVVGCPDVEPVVKVYMRICFTCQKMLEILQEKMFTLSYVTTSPDYKKCEQTIVEIHQETQKMKENIQKQLPQFVRTVDKFSVDSKNISESDMKSLVKHQDDLMDQFPRYIIAVDKLREMFPQTEQQIKLVRSLMQEKRMFYRDNVIVYRVAGRQLNEIMPKEEIEHRMITVNTDAINCACIVISQLAFEVLKICLQSKISENLAMAIRDVSEICEDDLKKMIEKKRKTDKDETWENHKRKVDEFIKAEMMSERRYLKLDLRKQTSDELRIFLKKESYRKIRSTLIQLRAKSASRAFIGTKEALEKLQNTTQNENLMT